MDTLTITFDDACDAYTGLCLADNLDEGIWRSIFEKLYNFIMQHSQGPAPEDIVSPDEYFKH